MPAFLYETSKGMLVTTLHTITIFNAQKTRSIIKEGNEQYASYYVSKEWEDHDMAQPDHDLSHPVDSRLEKRWGHHNHSYHTQVNSFLFLFKLIITCSIEKQTPLFSYQETTNIYLAYTNIYLAYMERLIQSENNLKQKIKAYSDTSKIDNIANTAIVIIQYIKNCEDNDLLDNLYNLLKKDEFQYLRNIEKPDLDKNWRTCSSKENNTYENTSKYWAAIEKAFSLQVAKNIQKPLGEVFSNNPYIGAKYKKLYDQIFPFFNVKRKNISPEQTKHITLFEKGDTKNFDQSYNKHFNRWS